MSSTKELSLKSYKFKSLINDDNLSQKINSIAGRILKEQMSDGTINRKSVASSQVVLKKIITNYLIEKGKIDLKLLPLPNKKKVNDLKELFKKEVSKQKSIGKLIEKNVNSDVNSMESERTKKIWDPVCKKCKEDPIDKCRGTCKKYCKHCDKSSAMRFFGFQAKYLDPKGKKTKRKKKTNRKKKVKNSRSRSRSRRRSNRK